MGGWRGAVECEGTEGEARAKTKAYNRERVQQSSRSGSVYQKQASPFMSFVCHQVLTESGFGPITTEIAEAKPFYYAEDYHQQYLNKVPGGYCGLRGTGVSCPSRT